MAMRNQTQNQISAVHFQTEERRQAELNRMKIIASSLFVLAALVFALASVYEKQYVWMGFVRATAEAAMVGAIADWFAVTALFRHPLGLKIPHTAIIPRRKARLARSFAQFFQNNFLSEQVIVGWLRSINIVGTTSNWLSQRQNSRAIADFLAVAIRGVLEVVNDEEVQQLIEHALVAQIRSVRITPVVGNFLAVVLSGPRQQELFEKVLDLLTQAVDDNEDAIRAKIAKETPWWLPDAVDNAIYDRIIVALDNTLHEINSDPDHPARAQFYQYLTEFIDDLKNSPDMIERGELLKEDFLEDPGVREFSSSLWVDIKASLLEFSHNPNSHLHDPIQQTVEKLGQTLRADRVLQAKINDWIEAAVQYLVRIYGHEIGKLIAQTIDSWDPDATTQKIELQVGKDLQYIRINGTLVGGLVGLAIHTVAVLLFI
jgi:uncharacterized membrane-anchored protein YjiN (DUF445 family)